MRERAKHSTLNEYLCMLCVILFFTRFSLSVTLSLSLYTTLLMYRPFAISKLTQRMWILTAAPQGCSCTVNFIYVSFHISAFECILMHLLVNIFRFVHNIYSVRKHFNMWKKLKEREKENNIDDICTTIKNKKDREKK